MAGTKVKSLTIDNRTGGIGSDKYLSVPNGCADGEGLDIRQGKRVILNTHNTNNVVSFGESKITYMDQNYYSSSDGYIFSPEGDKLYQFKSTDDNIRNIVYNNINDINTTMFISEGKVHKLQGDLITSVSKIFTYTSGWSVSGSGYIHSVGNTNSLRTTTTFGTTNRYKIEVTITSITEGSCVVNLGSTLGTITSPGTYTYFITPSIDDYLSFVPTSDCNININSISIRTTNIVENWHNLPNSSLLTPILRHNGMVYIGNGKTLCSIDQLGIFNEHFTLEEGTQIVSLTLQDNNMILWCRDGQGSSIRFWGFTSKVPDRTIPIYNELIQNVIQQNTYHLVFTGGDYGIKKIWKGTPYQLTMMYQIPEGRRWNTTSENLVPSIPIYYGGLSNNDMVNNVESFGNLSFFPGYHKVLSYGKRIPGFPDSLFADYSLRHRGISAMYAYDGELRIAYESDYSPYDYQVITLKLDNYENISSDNYYEFGSRGYISFNPVMFIASKQKNGQRISLGYRTPEDTFLSLYYRKDRETNIYTFIVDETVNPVATDPIIGDTYYTNGSASKYIVTKVTKYKNYMFIETENYDFFRQPRRGGVLTKIAGTGDSSITTIDFHNYRHISIVDSVNEPLSRQYVKEFTESFFEVQFRVELFTRDGTVTPELNDFSLIYEELADV